MRLDNLQPRLSSWQWQAQAACRGMDSSVFFPPFGERGTARRARESLARGICEPCAVRSACASFATATRQPYGVWGGMTERERAEADRSRATI